MEEWENNFLSIVESLADEFAYQLENFFNDVEDFLDEVATIVENSLNDHQCGSDLADLFEDRNSTYSETPTLSENYPDTSDQFPSYSYPVEPSCDTLPACMGCRNYHGQVYGNSLLVCGMHPYGRGEDKYCPDWEGFNS